MSKLYIVAILLIFAAYCSTTKQTRELTAYDFQKELNREYIDEGTSPLYKQDRMNFIKHDFFPVKDEYRVQALLTKVNSSDTIAFPTTSGETKLYTEYAEAIFEIRDTLHKLMIYRSLALMNTEKYKNHLFLPFRDLTNDESSYAGGRYIDLQVTDKDYLWVDFNQAYNPYCAYSEEYNCPIVPNSNFVNTKIEAGVRMKGGHFDYHKD